MPYQNDVDRPTVAAGWSLPRDRGFQAGVGLAVLSPIFTIGVALLAGASDTRLGWGLLHVAAFGLIEAVWIAPLAAACAILGRRRFALGLAIGGSVLVATNGLAWLVALGVGAG